MDWYEFWQTWRRPITIAIAAVVTILIAWLLVRLNRRFFRRLQRNRKNIQLSFFQHIVSIMIVLTVLLFAVSAFSGAKTIWQTIFGGTAIISAVLAFAAQDVIKDILAGLMISTYRPFEIGNRIELENGVAGIVEEITMRHVVILEIDSVRRVIPNSKINAMQLTNCSYHSAQRSLTLRYPVGYESDLELVKDLIAEAVRACPRTVPEQRADGTERYRPVYFLSFADSALIMSTTVYYEAGTPTEAVRDDVNTRVRETLRAHGVEIPYNYVTVVQAEPKKEKK